MRKIILLVLAICVSMSFITINAGDNFFLEDNFNYQSITELNAVYKEFRGQSSTDAQITREINGGTLKVNRTADTAQVGNLQYMRFLGLSSRVGDLTVIEVDFKGDAGFFDICITSKLTNPTDLQSLKTVPILSFSTTGTENYFTSMWKPFKSSDLGETGSLWTASKWYRATIYVDLRPGALPNGATAVRAFKIKDLETNVERVYTVPNGGIIADTITYPVGNQNPLTTDIDGIRYRFLTAKTVINKTAQVDNLRVTTDSTAVVETTLTVLKAGVIAPNADVYITDALGNRVAKGKTDVNGLIKFYLPKGSFVCTATADEVTRALNMNINDSYNPVKTLDVLPSTAFKFETTYLKGDSTTFDISSADKVKINIAETSSNEITPILATYDTENKLVAAKIGSKGAKEMTADFDHTKKVKILCWDSELSLKPIETPSIIFNNQANAQNVEVAKIFSDGMVLQRNAPVRIFGTSKDKNGSIVSVTFGETTALGAVLNGEWEVMLPSMSANATGRKLSVFGLETSFDFNDVLVGDVYFASGQSNMAFGVNSSNTAAEAVANAKETDNIRLFYQAPSTANLALNPNWKIEKQANPVSNCFWEKATDLTVGRFSAVAYNFAKSVQDKTGASVPIGIIQTAIGGTSLAENSPNEVNTSNNITHANGSYVYNTMIAPAIKYSAKGMLWYQGEGDSSNDGNLFTYTDRFKDFVDYINNKNGNDLDILYVQLSSHSSIKITKAWQVAKFRAMQTQMLSQIPNASMIVSMDKGAKEGAEDTYLAHPRDKKILGERFADIVLYGKNSPMPKTIVYDETGATITFLNAGTGLSSKNGDLKGFELIVGNNAYEAVATITGTDTVRVEGATNPSGVRYGYYQEASQYVANLINSDDLPAPTFADGENANTIAPISRGVLDDYYLNYSEVPGLGAKVYGFDFSNDTQGFTSTNGNISTENQALKFEPTQRDGMLTSQDLTMSSSGQMMKIRYKNTTNTHAMQVYFTTSTDAVFNASKMLDVSIHSNMSDYADWYVNLGANTNWKDIITKIRIDPVDESSSGTIYIQSIEFYEYEPPVERFWTFEETQDDTTSFANGWTASPNGNATFAKENGNLKVYISNTDAYMYKTVAIPAKYNKVKIKYKNTTTRGTLQVYFSTAVAANKYKSATLQTGMTDFGEITVDMSTMPEWTGTITNLRLDIANGAGTSGDFYIESIEVLQ